MSIFTSRTRRLEKRVDELGELVMDLARQQLELTALVNDTLKSAHQRVGQMLTLVDSLRRAGL